MIDWEFLYNKYIRKVRKFDGFIWDYHNPKGMLIFHQEEFLNNIILNKGESFIDVGSNVGAWSIRASKYYSFIHSFEPNLIWFRSLNRNIKLNHINNIISYNFALDVKDGITEQAILDSSSLGKPYQPMIKSKVFTTTLDILKWENNISVLKLDTEGASKRIIEGGLKTISEHRPKIIVEVHTEEESQIPRILNPLYEWRKEYRNPVDIGEWLYKEDGKQVFLIGEPKK